MTDYFPTYRELVVMRRYGFDDIDCIAQLWQKRYGGIQNCPTCGRKAKFYQLNSRRTIYSAGACGHQVSVIAGTIFEKSTQPLSNWFDAIYQIYVSEGKVPARELMRRYGISYKSAWRMKHQILDYLHIAMPKFGGFSYQYSSLKNGRYSQPDYIAKHNL